jgi:hypothetical protein
VPEEGLVSSTVINLKFFKLRFLIGDKCICCCLTELQWAGQFLVLSVCVTTEAAGPGGPYCHMYDSPAQRSAFRNVRPFVCCG